MSLSARQINCFLIFFILCCGVIVYINSLDGDFLIDDTVGILYNLKIQDFGQYLKEDFNFDLGCFTDLSYAFNWWLSQDNPFSYHLFNLILHLLCSVLLYLLCLKLFKGKDLAFLSTLIFVIHPIHTEAVSWISARGYLLASFFYLLAFFSYLQLKRNIFAAVFLALFFMLGVLSSSTIFTLPLLIIAYEFLFKEKEERLKLNKSSLVIILTCFIASLVSLLSLFLQRGVFPRLVYKYNGISYLILITKAFSYYLKILLFPFKRALFHPFAYSMTIDFFRMDFMFWFGVVVILASIFSFYKLRKNFKPLAFGILWFFVTFSVYSNLIPICNVVSERYLYLPSIGFCIIMAALFLKVWEIINKSEIKRTLRILALAVLTTFLCAYSTLTAMHNVHFSNVLVYWVSNVNQFPDGYKAYNNLAGFFFKLRDLKDALAYSHVNLIINQKQPHAWCNLGLVYFTKGDFLEARKCYEEALKLEPNYFPAIRMLKEINSKKELISDKIN